MRNKMKCAVAVLAIFGFTQVATAQSGSNARLSHAELRQMERGAHTAQQYQELAAYYRVRELNYQRQADAEMEEWARRMQFFTSLYAKPPTPVDSSRNRYEYLQYEQRQMNVRAAHYEELAAAAAK